MKRIQLKHGTARVSNNASQELIDALNEMSELAYLHNYTTPAMETFGEHIEYGDDSETLIPKINNKPNDNISYKPLNASDIFMKGAKWWRDVVSPTLEN